MGIPACATKDAGVDFRTLVVDLKKIKASRGIADWLDLTTRSPLVYLKRLRYIENEPFCPAIIILRLGAEIQLF